MNDARRRIPMIALLAAVLPAACTVGPDFEPPARVAPGAWTGADPGASDRPVPSAPVNEPADLAAWWTRFNDPTLTWIIERVAADNLTLAQAQSRVRQARAVRSIAAGALLPTVDASASYQRSRSRVGPVASTANFFRAGFDASWEIDVFGGLRRGVEAADADLEAAFLNRESILVSLEGEAATAYFDLRGAQRQLGIARENLNAQRRTLELTQQRLDAGFVSALDVANARANVTQTESQIPNYDAQFRAAAYALGVLVGQEPDALLQALTPGSPPAAIPDSIPVGLPSELLERRPDLRAAEASLHAATARVGVAVAGQFPRFSLTGSFGTQGRDASSVVSLANHFWSISPAVTLPLFTGGRVEGNIEEARAVAEQAALGYRQAVDLALSLYNAGRTDFLNVLSAQRSLYATEALLTQSETNIATDLVALFKALGGGWAPPQPPAQTLEPE